MLLVSHHHADKEEIIGKLQVSLSASNDQQEDIPAVFELISNGLLPPEFDPKQIYFNFTFSPYETLEDRCLSLLARIFVEAEHNVSHKKRRFLLLMGPINKERNRVTLNLPYRHMRRRPNFWYRDAKNRSFRFVVEVALHEILAPPLSTTFQFSQFKVKLRSNKYTKYVYGDLV